MKVANFCETLISLIYRNNIIYTFTAGTPSNLFIFPSLKKKGDKTKFIDFSGKEKTDFQETFLLISNERPNQSNNNNNIILTAEVLHLQ